MKNALMLLNTYSTKSNAAIAQIAVAYFDWRKKQITESLIVNIDSESLFGLNGDEQYYDFDDKTLEWWEHNGHMEDLLDNQISIHDAIKKVTNFLDKDTVVWCKKGFDDAIFFNACVTEKIFCPVQFNNYMDLSTLCYLGNTSMVAKTYDSKKDIVNISLSLMEAMDKVKEPV